MLDILVTVAACSVCGMGLWCYSKCVDETQQCWAQRTQARGTVIMEEAEVQIISPMHGARTQGTQDAEGAGAATGNGEGGHAESMLAGEDAPELVYVQPESIDDLDLYPFDMPIPIAKLVSMDYHCTEDTNSDPTETRTATRFVLSGCH
mmetsp:Transcript_20809/g.45046  ORF Transcript_20809/g.45046 Transcript_20809/m.45046 type:complete len:149 (-) Transcript_20809:79-525(-)